MNAVQAFALALPSGKRRPSLHVKFRNHQSKAKEYSSQDCSFRQCLNQSKNKIPSSLKLPNLSTILTFTLKNSSKQEGLTTCSNSIVSVSTVKR